MKMNKQKIIICILAFISFKLFSESLLIPFEIEGKIGFVNQDLQIIFQPAYKSIFKTRKKMAIVKDFDSDLVILFSNRRKDVNYRESFFYGNTGFLGEDYYFKSFPNSKSKFDKYVIYDFEGNEIADFYDRTLYSSTNTQWIKCRHERKSSGTFIDDYMNLTGNLKWPDNDFHSILFKLPDDNSFVVKDLNFNDLIVDESCQLISKELSTIDGYSNGLFLGAKSFYEKGFFDKNLNLIIGITGYPEYGRSFNSGVISCIIENGLIYIYEPDKKTISSDWAIINNMGEIVKQGIHAKNISNFSDEGTAIITMTDDKKYLINKSGEIITKEYYDEIQESINGYYRAKKANLDYLLSSETGESYCCRKFK